METSHTRNLVDIANAARELQDGVDGVACGELSMDDIKADRARLRTLLGTVDATRTPANEPRSVPTDYTDPATIDVDTVIGNINHAHRIRGHMWTDERSWPNVTVKALADEVEALRSQLAAAHDVIRRLRGGWRPGKNMAVVVAGSPRPEPEPVWMGPTMRHDSEPMTPAHRAVLDAADATPTAAGQPTTEDRP